MDVPSKYNFISMTWKAGLWIYVILYKGLVAGCRSFLFIFHILWHTYIQSFTHNTFIRRHSPWPLSMYSSLVNSVGKTFLWCRAENRTRACRTASHAAPCLEPRRTITETRRTITETRRTISEPRRTITEPRRTMSEPRRTIILSLNAVNFQRHSGRRSEGRPERRKGSRPGAAPASAPVFRVREPVFVHSPNSPGILC